ncbi:MAG TPA: aspartate--tRNA ligase [Thermodesulfobacteriota bacterium]|nr:aspartate--tRNA ligase [Thermodesulfobacteriota bacterium]
MNWHDRVYCGALGSGKAGESVLLYGWVDAHRDHGDLFFIHLRDWTGIVQVVFDRTQSIDIFDLATMLRDEFCIAVRGMVVKRKPGTENLSLQTGDIEVVASDLTIVNPARPLPFMISEKAMVAGTAAATPGQVVEDLRLQYRYLDLRRPSMQDNLIKRAAIVAAARRVLEERGFIEVETPNLTKSTPEGARDYIVPSRVHQGSFYALPQSPQLFKQLLMVAGLERYYQIARCFRDEDLRPNRQPEFTQLDIEAAFIDEEFLYELIEEVVVQMFAAGGRALPRPFPRMTYQEAIATTGSDRPDLRFGLRFIEATDIFSHTRYSIFQQVLKRGGRILGINVKGQSQALSKNILQNEYAKEIVPRFGGKGMSWMRVTGGTLDSNIVQFFSPQEQQALLKRFGGEDGDVFMLIADPDYRVVTSVLGQLRLHVANQLDLIPRDVYAPVWVTDFPLFDPTEDGGITSTHHPFTSPNRLDFDPANITDLLSLTSRAYDIVLNGEELGGGSIRINNRHVQDAIFQALQLGPEQIEQKFGFFLNALEYGAPPHGGIALGIDRVIAMILGTGSIRDVIAFPKNRSAFCPLTQAPSTVTREQLAELGLLHFLGEVPAALSLEEKEKDMLEFLAWVSRIGYSETEVPFIREALTEAEHLSQAITLQPESVEPLFSVIPLHNHTRPGDRPVLHPAVETGDIFGNAPAVKGDFFKVAAILE